MKGVEFLARSSKDLCLSIAVEEKALSNALSEGQ